MIKYPKVENGKVVYDDSENPVMIDTYFYDELSDEAKDYAYEDFVYEQKEELERLHVGEYPREMFDRIAVNLKLLFDENGVQVANAVNGLPPVRNKST